jgi:hypothetical protein
MPSGSNIIAALPVQQFLAILTTSVCVPLVLEMDIGTLATEILLELSSFLDF